MLRVAIVDDETKCINDVENLLKEYSKAKFIIEKFNSPKEFLTNNIKKYHLIFLDIEMPEVNGIELAKKIRLKNNQALLYYVSNYFSYVTKAMHNTAFTFITKPIDREDFFMEIDRGVKKINDTYSRLKIEWEKAEFYIPIDNIVYIESYNKHCNIIMADGSEYKTAKRLFYLADILKRYNFAQPHKSYLVNLKYVSGTKKSEINFIEGVPQINISITRNFKDSFSEKMNRYYSEMTL